MKRLQILWFVFLICLCMSARQWHTTRILPDISVFELMKDRDGLMWIGTNNGLYCYDGCNTIRLQCDAKSPMNTVNGLVESADGSIIAAMRSGVYIVDLQDFSCRHIYKDIYEANALCLSGDFLFVGFKQGLACIPVAQYYSKWLAEEPSVRIVYMEPNVMSCGNNVVDVIPDGKGGCWLATQTQKIMHYEPVSGKKTEYAGTYLDHGAELRRLCLVEGKLYIATGNMGMYVLDIKREKFTHLDSVKANVITDLNADKKGRLCISTDGNGAYVVDTKTDSVVQHFNSGPLLDDNNTEQPIASNAVYTFRHDCESDVNWFGYFIEGCEFFSCRKPLFESYRYKDFDSEQLQTTCYCINGRDKLIGTRSGLYFISEDKGRVRYFSPEELGASIVTDICFFAGKYIVSCYDCGLNAIDAQTLAVERMAGSELFSMGNFSKVCLTPDKKNLIVLSNLGMFVLDAELKVTKHLTAKNSGLPDSYLPYMMFDSSDKAWISSLKGLAIYDLKDGIVHSTGFPEGFFNKVPDLSFNETLDGRVIAIGANDVYVCDVGLKAFNRLDVYERMHVNRIAFIYPLEGHYWMATDKGVFVLDKYFRPLCQLNEADNLPSPVFNRQFVEYSADTLWFSHSHGLFYLTAEARGRALKKRKGKVVLSHIVVGGKDEPKAVFSAKNKNLDVSWNLMSDKLQVQPLPLSYNRKCTRFYEWTIDGGEWNLCPGDMMIEINHLLPGNHELEIRLIGNEQAYGIYTVKVRPSLQFYMEVVILIFLVLSLLMLVRFVRSTRRATVRRWTEKQRMKVEAELEAKNAAISEFVKSKDNEYQALLVKVRSYMEEKQAYKNPDLRMADVAKAVGTNATNLSRMFNLYLHQNFFDFVNSYRMAEFKRLIDSLDCSVYTISAISDMCGFKKSSFFSVFKKHEGCTPAQYLKNKKNAETPK